MDERFEPVPDAITPLSGYRIWRVVDEGAEPIFVALTNDSREWVGATCGWASATCSITPGQLHPLPSGPLEWGPITEHRTPGEDCSCGFYATKELQPEQLMLAASSRAPAPFFGNSARFVLGRVALAGKVIEHDSGYRAERARIVELIPLKGDVRAVKDIARRAAVSVGRPVKVPRMRRFWTHVLRLRVAWVISSSQTPPEPKRNRIDYVWLIWLAIAAVRVVAILNHGLGSPSP